MARFGLAAMVVTFILIIDGVAIAIMSGSAAPQQATIGDIITNPAAYQDKLVTIECKYGGWTYGGDVSVTNLGPPVTKSDWCVYDNTGAIYVQANGAAEILESSYPGTLMPTDENCIGVDLVIKGTVKVSVGGVPYLG